MRVVLLLHVVTVNPRLVGLVPVVFVMPHLWSVFALFMLNITVSTGLVKCGMCFAVRGLISDVSKRLG